MNFIYQAFGYVMQFCYRITNNYALALLLFAVFAQLIQLPITISQQKNYRKQTMLRPQELAIKKQYKNKKDPESQRQMQLEVQQMYQKNGYNQLAGCLPMILLFILIIPLYQIIRMPLTYISGINETQVNRLYATVAYSNMTGNPLNEIDADFVVGSLLGTDGKPLSDADAKIKESVSATVSDTSEALESAAASTVSAATPTKKSFADYYKDISTKGEIELAGLLSGKNNGKTFTDDQLKAVGIDTAVFNRDQLNFDLFGVSLLLVPGFGSTDTLILMIIPLLVFATSVFTQMLITKWQTPAQIGPDGEEAKMPGGAVMKWGMPLMSAVFAMTLQSAVGLYWIYGNIIRVGQSYLMAKIMPLKRWTPEELAAAEKALNAGKKKKKVIMIEVDEDDNSYSGLEISPEVAEKKMKKHQSGLEADALKKAAELDAELDAKAAELAEKKKAKAKESEGLPELKEDISHDDKKRKNKK